MTLVARSMNLGCSSVSASMTRTCRTRLFSRPPTASLSQRRPKLRAPAFLWGLFAKFRTTVGGVFSSSANRRAYSSVRSVELLTTTTMSAGGRLCAASDSRDMRTPTSSFRAGTRTTVSYAVSLGTSACEARLLRCLLCDALRVSAREPDAVVPAMQSPTRKSSHNVPTLRARGERLTGNYRTDVLSPRVKLRSFRSLPTRGRATCECSTSCFT